MQDKKFRVLILGRGEMGQAMEFLLGPRHYVRSWQRHTPATESPVPLSEAVPNSDFILFCLPATAHADVAARIAPLRKNHTLCISIAKGLDEAGRLPGAVLAQAFGAQHVALLYGPMIAEEIRAGKPAFAECGVTDLDSFERIAALYHGSALHLERARDFTGLSWSVILKNVYAMAFGMADELNLGDNTRGYLTVCALQELAAIVQHLGSEPATPYRLAGLGDLITTATSAGSHHHELGRRLVRSETNLKGEGIHTLAMIEKFQLFDTDNFPLLRLIAACAREPSTTTRRMTDFIKNI